jgi:predicted nucleic acid-binding protein
VAAYVDLIQSASVVLDDPTPSGTPTGIDPRDVHLVDLGRAARVDALVTGDRGLLALAGVLPVRTPHEFLESLA